MAVAGPTVDLGSRVGGVAGRPDAGYARAAVNIGRNESSRLQPAAERGGEPVHVEMPVVVFAFLFGVSMDYQVFIISRMREAYDRTGDTNAAVIESVGRTGRLVTGAALILGASWPSALPPEHRGHDGRQGPPAGVAAAAQRPVALRR